MKIVMISAVMMMYSFFSGENNLTGRWESKPSEKGNVTGVVFKPDNSFEAYINKKAFASGKYTLLDNVFTMVDNGCDGKYGIYRIVFFAGTDSLRLQPIEDSCTGRREGMKRLVMGRVK